ncbi:hypothetical protein M3223_11730 [Paenibacillus pasadenensis]|uniref:hypothetical protein n=1 Tax=Paenibacillus pasadenensis TaxID=217090 RepID=UPI00203BEB82|nr:hypothetical protein [Paenibacillus pasadenensis]MCM3748022.1 hypothetical protein [Paenibacillus pasadenensis]
MAKTNWKFNDLVTETDLNEIGGELNAAAAHAAETSGAHGATSAATAGTLMQRDANGRAKVAAPAAADDVARKDTVEAAVQPLVADLTDAAPAALTLVPGQQVVTVTRDTPLRIKGIMGRTLANQLGRNGSFEGATTGWVMSAPNGGLLESSSEAASTGTNSAKVTIASGKSSANMTSSNIGLRQGIHGRFYVLIADAKCGTCTNIRLRSDTSSVNGNYVSSKTDFQPTFIRWDTASYQYTMYPTFDITGAAGAYGYIDSVRMYELTQAEYDAIASMTPAQVAVKYPFAADIKNVNGVYVRNVAGKTVDDQYVYYPDCQLAASLDGSVYDELYTDNAGQARVKRQFNSLDLTGELAWVQSVSGTGYKGVTTSITGPVNDAAVVAKFDGKILARFLSGTSFSLADQQVLSGVYNSVVYNTISLSVANADSGWGDNYTPTADEIKAYFNGWVMYEGAGGTYAPYNGTGTKWWGYRLITWTTSNRSALSGGTNTLPTTTAWFNNAFTPYHLQYQLATPTDEPICSEGAIMLTEGINTLEVGYGAVVRERVIVSDGSGLPRINYDFASKLQFRTNKDVDIYRNGKPDKLWRKYYNSTIGYGLFVADLDAVLWDNSAVYEVTYLALDTYLIGIPPAEVSAEYATNQRSVTDELTKAATYLVGRMTVLENGAAQAKQQQWIAPTLLNGTQNFSSLFHQVAYMKDSMGFVHIRGFVTNPSNMVIFILPPGYRPSRTLVYASTSASTTSGANCLPATINIQGNGIVQAALNAQVGFMTLDGITFQAEI